MSAKPILVCVRWRFWRLPELALFSLARAWSGGCFVREVLIPVALAGILSFMLAPPWTLRPMF
jgi:hypothetical protein